MKHISFADKTLFVGDDVADLLVEYAALLGADQSADSVRVLAVGQDGNEVEVDFVLNAATNLASESTNSDMQPPENSDAEAYMRTRIATIRNPPEAEAEQARDVEIDDQYLT